MVGPNCIVELMQLEERFIFIRGVFFFRRILDVLREEESPKGEKIISTFLFNRLLIF